jgi:hypothetical protein
MRLGTPPGRQRRQQSPAGFLTWRPRHRRAHDEHLDLAHPLPEAPWFEPGASWSARRVLLHVIAETAQHAGHADIIRESLDGAKSMG